MKNNFFRVNVSTLSGWPPRWVRPWPRKRGCVDNSDQKETSLETRPDTGRYQFSKSLPRMQNLPYPWTKDRDPRVGLELRKLDQAFVEMCRQVDLKAMLDTEMGFQEHYMLPALFTQKEKQEPAEPDPRMHQVKDSLTLIEPSSYVYESFVGWRKYSQQLYQRQFLASMQVPPNMRPKERESYPDSKLCVEDWWTHRAVKELQII